MGNKTSSEVTELDSSVEIVWNDTLTKKESKIPLIFIDFQVRFRSPLTYAQFPDFYLTLKKMFFSYLSLTVTILSNMLVQ